MQRYDVNEPVVLSPCEDGEWVRYADAQATVEALQRERDKLREATKVICGHCCEPMAIPSKAILQSKLSTLQGLVRALPVYEADALITVDGDLDEIDRPALRSAVMELLEYRAALTPAGGASQRWMRERPTKPGVYWFRWDKDRDAIIVVVLIEDCDWRVLEMGNEYSGAFAGYASGEWQGPLTPNEATE